MYERSKEVIAQKSVLKQNIFAQMKGLFEQMKQSTQSYVADLSSWVAGVDNRVIIEYTDVSLFEFWVQVGGDTLMFTMHTNVFTFDEKGALMQSKYVQENPNRGYCGMIEVYNFLSDSIKYERNNDVGELIARLFVNIDHHFFVEGEGQLSFLWNNYAEDTISADFVSQFIEACTCRSIEYDLWAPPFASVKYIPLSYAMTKNGNTPHATQKRLGFVG